MSALPSGSVVLGTPGKLNICHLPGSSGDFPIYSAGDTTAGTRPLDDISEGTPGFTVNGATDTAGGNFVRLVSNDGSTLIFAVRNVTDQLLNPPGPAGALITFDTKIHATDGTPGGTQLAIDLPGADGVAVSGTGAGLTLFHGVTGTINVGNPGNVPIFVDIARDDPLLYEIDGTAAGAMTLATGGTSRQPHPNLFDPVMNCTVDGPYLVASVPTGGTVGAGSAMLLTMVARIAAGPAERCVGLTRAQVFGRHGSAKHVWE
jgi:hypothetical protein